MAAAVKGEGRALIPHTIHKRTDTLSQVGQAHRPSEAAPIQDGDRCSLQPSDPPPSLVLPNTIPQFLHLPAWSHPIAALGQRHSDTLQRERFQVNIANCTQLSALLTF